jgi:DNA-binding NtrC family response regulator
MISESAFREDLYYRLKVVTIWLPPLSQRLDDIEPLARFHLARHAAALNLDIPTITEEALATLRQLPWPGNVRELANTIQKALIFNRGVPIRSEDILAAVKESHSLHSTEPQLDAESLRQYIRQELQSGQNERHYDTAMDRFAAMLIEEALSCTGGNRSRAAKLLGISRPTLHAKIEKFGLTFETSIKAPGA